MPYLFSTYSAGSPILTGYLSKHFKFSFDRSAIRNTGNGGVGGVVLHSRFDIFAKKDVLA